MRGAPSSGAPSPALGTKLSVHGAPAPQGAMPRPLAALLWLRSLQRAELRLEERRRAQGNVSAQFLAQITCS